MAETAIVNDENQPTIGLIGMGDMGRMYTRYLSEAGWSK